MLEQFNKIEEPSEIKLFWGVFKMQTINKEKPQ